ncbi:MULTISPECIES: helix-turn-helix transcriptional regulator [Parafrankia]|uniref:LuxR family transcriptional regulator n=1 Tax=Parafrankia colletiae TaxID=573497 RepID=A0A1S1R8M4_9ACTN|nr:MULTISPECIES: LuxR C-terminal-related transcriptional regulator [Parafrankia]MCK9900718.1 LuxR C-terminal-related transcriptional regulator [Frankia sp. Cpl3]OHV42327.1 LuxR family transcriptional regulator [Parafrankia colletiae]
MTSGTTDGCSVEAMLPRAVTRLRARTGADLAYGGSVDPRSRYLTISALDGNRTNALRGMSLPPGHGVGGRVVALGRPVVIDAGTRPRYTEDQRDWAVLGEDISSVVAVPVRAGGIVHAVLYCGVRADNPVPPAAVETALGVARRFEALLAERAMAARPDTAAATPGASRLRTLCRVDAELEELTFQTSDQALRERIIAVRDLLEDLFPDAAPPTRAQPFGLSPRELDVLRLVAEGMSNAETARRLAVSPETVKAYLRSIMNKLGVHNRTAAVNVARRSSLLP